MDYTQDKRIVVTLDAGGTNLVFSAMRGCKYIISPITLPSRADNLEACLGAMVEGFKSIIEQLPEAPVAISFAFPGPADYRRGIIGGYLPNFPSFREGVALGRFLEKKFNLPVFINNDGDLFAYGEAMCGALPDINRRIAAKGGNKRYHNLIGFTFGTGLGIGTVIDGRLNPGDNSCVETFCLRNPCNPEFIIEDGAAIRAIRREYTRLSEAEGSNSDSCETISGPEEKVAVLLTPYDIFLIAEGQKKGNKAAAQEAFRCFGEVAGEAFATAASLFDGIIAVGGGLTGAMKYIKPALLAVMRSSLKTASGDDCRRVQPDVFDLDDDEEFAQFARGQERKLRVFGSDEEVVYDPQKRLGIVTSRLGASHAISIGAYAFALASLDSAQ